MPEATINEDSYPGPWKDKVWLTKDLLVASPASDS